MLFEHGGRYLFRGSWAANRTEARRPASENLLLRGRSPNEKASRQSDPVPQCALVEAPGTPPHLRSLRHFCIGHNVGLDLPADVFRPKAVRDCFAAMTVASPKSERVACLDLAPQRRPLAIGHREMHRRQSQTPFCHRRELGQRLNPPAARILLRSSHGSECQVRNTSVEAWRFLREQRMPRPS